MSVYITGDTHGGFERFSKENFPEQSEMTRNDIMIICGDFGGIWNDTEAEREKLDFLESLPFTIVYVDGNHENFDRYYGEDEEFEIVNFHGSHAQKIRENVFHLLRGHVYDFEGKKFFCFGGASSHDISDGVLDPEDPKFEEMYWRYRMLGYEFRVNHFSWWKEELPSKEEIEFSNETLEKHGYTVDYVITHCLPTAVASWLGYTGSDILTDYFNSLVTERGLSFTKWHCGHYHTEGTAYGKFVIHYHDIERIM